MSERVRESGSPERPLTQRVEVGTYYIDGQVLWEVVEVHALGAVTVRNAWSGVRRDLGIDAFRRQMWRVK